jgi:hypothetical protein
MHHIIPRILLASTLSVSLFACLGGDDGLSPRAVARITGESESEGLSLETFLYRTDGSLCRTDWADDDFSYTEFLDHGKISRTYYYGDPENATYSHWDWITGDSVTLLLRYKGVPVGGATMSARRYFRNASGGVDSVRVYDPLDHHEETLLFGKAADSSWEVEHRRDPFDGATLSLYTRYFRNARQEIDSAYFYSRWYGGIHTNGDTNFNADTSRLVYHYDYLSRVLGGSKCTSPD